MEIHSGSRTLEAPRGNRYAPARGLLVMMMMMVILTSNKLRLSAVQLLYSNTVLTESACRCLFDTFCRYRLVLVGRARLAWASIWVPINRSEPSLHLGLLLPYQVCISLLLLFTLMIMHSSRGVTPTVAKWVQLIVLSKLLCASPTWGGEGGYLRG